MHIQCARPVLASYQTSGSCFRRSSCNFEFLMPVTTMDVLKINPDSLSIVHPENTFFTPVNIP